MQTQRTGAAVPAADRSAFTRVRGVPSWVAVLIAAAASLGGFAIEAGAGHEELGTVFALCYAAGCIAAVLLVRQSAVFTAVVQPPLLLFVAVPLFYSLMHGSEFRGLKGFLITCGYPLIERFPVMLFTSAAVLVIGMSRWYFAPSDADPEASVGLFAGLAARWTQNRRPQHGINRAAAPPSARGARSDRERSARSRNARPERAEDQSRRQSARRPIRDDVPADRRRQRPTRESGRPAEPRRRVPREGREDYPPRPSRSRRSGAYESHEAYPPYDGYPPARGPRPGSQLPPRNSQSHHPVSRVRYRGGDPDRPDYPPPRGR